MRKYVVTLTKEERDTLEALSSKGKHSSQAVLNALILLACDEGEHQAQRSTNEEISRVLNISMRKIDRVKSRFVLEGLDEALTKKKSDRIYDKKTDGDFEARLIALSCSEPPEGYSRWSLRLLADKMVELEYVDTISHEAVRQVLKKNELKPWRNQAWVIPPNQNINFVAQMERVLDVHKRPFDPQHPVVCMDESPKQLIPETRDSIPCTPGYPARHDYEYRRCGTCNIFIACEPLAGKRLVKITHRKTKQDCAEFLRDIAAQYEDADTITLVMDNLNTQGPGSLYETFAPELAKSLWNQFEFVYTPKHESWLNITEIELSVLTSQCLDRRMDSIEVVRREVKAWEESRNNKDSRINWQFTTEDARVKLSRL
ncbi:IS630 family transposase [Methanocalculus chunghsingensis]|nr:IS630 family transposase [Methanocalculus chunghsingensis]